MEPRWHDTPPKEGHYWLTGVNPSGNTPQMVFVEEDGDGKCFCVWWNYGLSMLLKSIVPPCRWYGPLPYPEGWENEE